MAAQDFVHDLLVLNGVCLHCGGPRDTRTSVTRAAIGWDVSIALVCINTKCRAYDQPAQG